VACLGALAARPAQRSRGALGPLAVRAVALAYVLTLALLMWGLLELAFAARPT